MDRKVHIVSLDVPYPPNYGGVVDIFNTIRNLHKAGVKIVLHCFEYGRGQQPELKKYCEEVYYYQRKKLFSLNIPYIVISRKDRLLKERLINANAPVLLEGLHSTYFVYKKEISENIWIRMSNVEFLYYHHLFKTSGNFIKKLYYLAESILLKKYEKQIATKGNFIAVSKYDQTVYQNLGAQCSYLPLMMDNIEITSLPGMGTYCLYHGNLSVEENEQAAFYLIEKIFKRLPFPLIIAGRDPSKRLKRLCLKNNINLVLNPDERKMEELISQAQIHVLPSFNQTGTKIKLIFSLQKGRHVVTNSNAVLNSDWGKLCHVADGDGKLITLIADLMNQPFIKEEIEKRKEIFSKEFDPEENTKKLISILFNQ